MTDAAVLAVPFAIAELQFRTLTHTNPGRCLVELHGPPEGRSVLAVASPLPAAGGPSLVNGACAIASRIQSDLLSTRAGRTALTLVVCAPVGARLVRFAESFDGWFGRPTFEPLTGQELAALAAGMATAAG